MIPKFIQIRVSNKDFRNLKKYRQCQIKQEISNKKKNENCNKDLTAVRNELPLKLRFVD